MHHNSSTLNSILSIQWITNDRGSSAISRPSQWSNRIILRFNCTASWAVSQLILMYCILGFNPILKTTAADWAIPQVSARTNTWNQIHICNLQTLCSDVLRAEEQQPEGDVELSLATTHINLRPWWVHKECISHYIYQLSIYLVVCS